jgi:hypothetical protein
VELRMLLRYQWAILLRSHRWIVPTMIYAVLVGVGQAGAGTSLSQGLDWSAAMLVPAVAVLTRSMLTAEPSAARACVAAATDPIRAQLAALLAALSGGVVLAVAGTCLELATTQAPPGNGLTTLLAGIVVAVVCLLVGSAAGALCNPPLLRNTGMAIMATIAAVLFSLAAGISPANAALRASGKATTAAVHWPGPLTLVAAVLLVAVTWAASVVVAAHRS